MAKAKGRSGRSQTRHDQEVRETAQKLQRQGWKVKADVKGFPQPDTINGVRPDVVATRGGKRRIFEVETEDSKGGARARRQDAAFRGIAQRSTNTTYTKKIIGD